MTCLSPSIPTGFADEPNIRTYQVTIDGEESDHNELRPHKNSKPTYSKILNTLISISRLSQDEYDFHMAVRVNFNHKTATKEKRARVLSKFKLQFGDDSRFSFTFRPIGNYADANSFQITNKEAFLCNVLSSSEIQQLYEEEAISLGLNTTELLLYIGQGSASCYAGKENHIIVDEQLNVKKCTVALDDPVNTVGIIDNDGVFEKNSNWELWTTDNLFKEKKCSSCFFISQCLSNNCRLKNIKRNCLVCPDGIIKNKERISSKIIDHIASVEGGEYEENIPKK